MSDARTHDYTRRYLGHDYIFRPKDGGNSASITGWGCGISNGDYLLLEHPNGGATRYRVTSIKYCANPSDMWSAQADFAPRQH